MRRLDGKEVVPHLTSAASIGRWAWIRSMVGARFDSDVHNARRLAEYRGATPAETLQRFRAVVDRQTAASGHTAAWLGEVVVHAHDIRRPLGIEHTFPVESLMAVATFFAARDFAVASATVSKGLRLDATDGPFTAGDGPLVSGPTLALVMVMAGRRAYLDDLTGPGATTITQRLDV
ncbi:hypothetical protein PSU4_38760 [Pseudonocardia sulfidoxydans NBRC 16205]|uniref:Mycothiol-dependent maleylpyruvate isomerase metal-binding domain-containing protein n=1 Tax=Pseudonocardia sulfidoxydans NBRC 16205 TaxID=1223511 RepID=A0A511DJD6_9PSEU|nr:maleylpyruvate isomerase family mycothiol-dependent enzyme [Pseudonocardia sulfidoxydans]GEL24922.1 hypothetical protein PSU4_38760 [Pseudonocardia sulfidoxydans NBRC 16205]